MDKDISRHPLVIALTVLIILLTLAVGWLLYRELGQPVRQQTEEIQEQLERTVPYTTESENQKRPLEDNEPARETEVKTAQQGVELAFVFASQKEDVWEELTFRAYQDGKVTHEKTVQSDNDAYDTAALVGNKVYFVNKRGDLAYYKLDTSNSGEVGLPGMDEPLFEHTDRFTAQVVDFLIDGNTIYYLKGGCAEALRCEARRHNLATGENELIKDNLPVSPIGGLSIQGFTEDKQDLVIHHSQGDAGIAKLEVNHLNLETGEYKTVEEYNARYCGENDEYCDEQQHKDNREYKKFREQQEKQLNPDRATCGDETMETEGKGRFLGCV